MCLSTLRAALLLPLRPELHQVLRRPTAGVADCSASRCVDPVAESAAAATLLPAPGFSTAPSAVASPVQRCGRERSQWGKLYNTRASKNVPELLSRTFYAERRYPLRGLVCFRSGPFTRIA